MSDVFNKVWLTYKASVVDKTDIPPHSAKLAFYGGAIAYSSMINLLAELPEKVAEEMLSELNGELLTFKALVELNQGRRQ